MEVPKIPTPAAAVPAAPDSSGPALTANIIASMLQAAPKTSDLIFSPGRAPQVELHGQLMQLKIKGVGVLSAEDTARIAADLIGRNSFAVEN
jgi:twitching motility protein PilT